MNKSFKSNIVIITLLFSLTITHTYSQIIYSQRIKSIRVEGSAEARFPIVLLTSQPLTISFDVKNSTPENFYVKLYHCDRNWNVTRSIFINDEFRNYSRRQIPFEKAPNGVTNYNWTYTIRIPNYVANTMAGMNDFENIKYSGNYKFEIWNIERTELLAEGKFFAVERISVTALNIYNRYLPSEISPMNQVNKAVFTFNFKDLNDNNEAPLIPNYIKTADIYRNRQLETKYRIDVDDNNPNTFIEGWGTKNLKFIVDNIQPGNNYRRLDLRNVDLYPPDKILRQYGGADLSRWLLKSPEDQNGTSTLLYGSNYADYVQFQFELIRPEEDTSEIIYVVGDFNNWRIDDKWRMVYDANTKQYKLLASLRRGAYDYQYVLNRNDWIALEGNDWRTKNVYTALLYYYDPNLGGYDRILLAAQKKSQGGTGPTSN